VQEAQARVQEGEMEMEMQASTAEIRINGDKKDAKSHKWSEKGTIMRVRRPPNSLLE